MQGKHLTYEEFEFYLNIEDVSEEYLCRVESIAQHLDECEQCRGMLEKVILMDSVCEEDTIAYGMDLLKNEAVIRRELFTEQLKKTEEDKRVRMLAETMRRRHPEQRSYSSVVNQSGQESFANMANSQNIQHKQLILGNNEAEEKPDDITFIEEKPVKKKSKNWWKPVVIGAGILLVIVLIGVIGLLLT